MKTFKLLLAICFVSFSMQSFAQTTDEIIANYYENTGGVDNWKKVQGVKTTATVNQGGVDFTVDVIQLRSGEQATIINFQGTEIKQNVFDGDVLWGHNFMTQKAEKSDAEATANFKQQSSDFIDSFLYYKEKGYALELLGKEEIDGTECFKLKLTKKPIMVDGKEEADVTFHYFDTENFVPLAVQSEIRVGPNKGQMSETKFSDYQEVDGLYFPFSMSQGLKGQPGQGINITKIELNPKVDAAVFKFPEETTKTDGKN